MFTQGQRYIGLAPGGFGAATFGCPPKYTPGDLDASGQPLFCIDPADGSHVDAIDLSQPAPANSFPKLGVLGWSAVAAVALVGIAWFMRRGRTVTANRRRRGRRGTRRAFANGCGIPNRLDTAMTAPQTWSSKTLRSPKDAHRPPREPVYKDKAQLEMLRRCERRINELEARLPEAWRYQ